MKAFNDIADFSTEELQSLISLASRLDATPEPDALKGKVLSLSNGLPYSHGNTVAYLGAKFFEAVGNNYSGIPASSLDFSKNTWDDLYGHIPTDSPSPSAGASADDKGLFY